MKILSYFLFLSLFFALSSCEEDTVTYDKGSYAVFGSPVSAISVSSQDVGVEILGSIMAQQSSDVTLNVTVDTENSTAVEGVDFTIDTPSITIPAGQVNGHFSITALYASAVTDGKKVVLNISSPDIETAVFNEIHTLTIRLSCPLPNDFPLEYGVQVQAFDSSAPTHLQTITPVVGEENTFSVNSFWGENFVGWATNNDGYNGQYVYSGKFTINCDNTVDFEGDDDWATGGTGTYNPSTGFITGTIAQSLFTDSFTVDITMIPNQ